MQKITVCDDIVLNNDTYREKIRLTPAGKLALMTPCSMKPIVSNNRKDEAGRSYLMSSLKEDDTNISVQFCILSDSYADINGILSAFVSEAKSGNVCGVSVIYKGISSLTKSGDYVLFNANLIKLASNG